ncbi:hypothetical protein STEG23_036103 [Scotinomys teguina]
MEVKAAAPRCQLLLIMLMAAMLLTGMKGSLLAVWRKITRTIELQESIAKDNASCFYFLNAGITVPPQKKTKQASKQTKTKPNQTKPNQTKTKPNQTKPNQTKPKPNQTKPNQTKPNQTKTTTKQQQNLLASPSFPPLQHLFIRPGGIGGLGVSHSILFVSYQLTSKGSR